jgi:hypothetical protein
MRRMPTVQRRIKGRGTEHLHGKITVTEVAKIEGANNPISWPNHLPPLGIFLAQERPDNRSTTHTIH